MICIWGLDTCWSLASRSSNRTDISTVLGASFKPLGLFIWAAVRVPSSGAICFVDGAATSPLPHMGWPSLKLGLGACFDRCPFPLVTGRCARCGENVVGEGTGCTAMDQVFHVECFTCMMCNNKLRGQPFYAVEKKAYCEPCYIVSTYSCLHPTLNTQTLETLILVFFHCYRVGIQLKPDNPMAALRAPVFSLVFRRIVIFSASWVDFVFCSNLSVKWSGQSRGKKCCLWLFQLCKEQTMQWFL